MPRKKIYTDVMAVIERRIAAGDYMLKDLPGERRLADEVGVSYMTARMDHLPFDPASVAEPRLPAWPC